MCCMLKPLSSTNIDQLGQKVNSIYAQLNTDLVDNCDYIEEDNVRDIEITKCDLSIIQWNICGILGNEAELVKLANFSHKQKIDIVLLNETLLTKSSEHKISFDGYDYFGQVRKNKKEVE